MNIADFDKNLKVETSIDRTDIVWFDAADFSPAKIYGALGGTKPYARMDLDVAGKISPNIRGLSRNCAGIRLRIKTDSPYIAIKTKWGWQNKLPQMAKSGSCGFDVYKFQNGEYIYLRSFMPPIDCEYGYESILDLSDKMTEYVINFPPYQDVDTLYIGVKDGSEFEETTPYFNEKPVVFYGSSITQGGCCSRPGNAYENYLSRMLNIDYLNLGLAGNCLAEPELCEYMSHLSMSCFVCDYDHNAPTVEHLQNTHFALYEAIRKNNPDIPYIMMSRPDYYIDRHEDNLKRTIIMESFRKAKELGDNNVYFIDGASMFGTNEREACSADGCHPNDLGFYRMAKAIYPTLKYALKIQ